MKKTKYVHNFQNTLTGGHPRSKFNRNFDHKTTLNAGDLIPVFWDEVLPGDTFNITTKAIIRQNTLIKPVMDNSYVDITYWFVPERLIWDDFKKHMGENVDSEWKETVKPEIPQVKSPSGGWEIGTIADYMGLPVKKDNLKVNALPFRAYALIWNEWFRDQNLQKPTHINKGNADTKGSNGNNYITDIEGGGKPAKSGKYHDYFTSALPEPQKGNPITISLGGEAQVHTKKSTFVVNEEIPISFRLKNPVETNQSMIMGVLGNAEGSNARLTGEMRHGTITSKQPINQLLAPNNLYADLSKINAITINELRNAITLQQMLELDARGGTRYTEYLKSHFGVTSPDSRQQRPEYLGGTHEPIQIAQIAQTSSTDDKSPQANLSALGYTHLEHGSVNKSFTEHGYIMGLATIRYNHTYQQGLEVAWTRKTRNDRYDPIFANIGEQPIYNREIYYQGNNKDNEIFGYKEPWNEYREKPNRVSGKMRSGTESLDVWHYGDNYTELPKLSADWIIENEKNIDRTLALASDKQPQFNAEFYFQNIVEREMPVFSIPGLKKI